MINSGSRSRRALKTDLPKDNQMDLKTIARAAGYMTLLVAVGACSKKSEPAMTDQARMVSEVAPAAAPEPPPPPPSVTNMAEARMAEKTVADVAVTSATPAQQMGSSAATFVDGERKFIRTAGAQFDVKDVYVAALGIEDTVASHGGFVVKNDINTHAMRSERHPVGDGKLLEVTEYSVHGRLTVRVPSAKTQEFLRAIVSHIVFLEQRNFSARDAQFDLLRRQLDAIRNQETQGELGDAIDEGGKLSQRTAAIGSRNDAKAARDAALLEKKEFEDQVAFSTIELTLKQPSKVLQTERVDIRYIFDKSRPGFFARLGEQLRGGWEGLLSFVLALVGIWPVLLIGGLMVPVLWRLRRRKVK